MLSKTLLKNGALAGLLALVLILVAAHPALAATTPLSQTGAAELDEALDAAVNWLVANHQNSDGGFASFSAGADAADSDVPGTVDALLALGAAGADSSGSLGYLESHSDALADYAAQDGSTAGKLVWALVLAGEDPKDFGGRDYVGELNGHLASSGSYNVANAFGQSLALVGLAAAGEGAPQQASDWLTGLQSVEGDLEGSFDDGFGTDGNSDATAMAAMALYMSGSRQGDRSLDLALAFLDLAQLTTGGWEYGAGFGENANSTSLVLLALSSLGEDVVAAESDWARDGVSPVDALLSWQGESGAFQADFGEGRLDDFFATVQAILALGTIHDSMHSSEVGPTAVGGDSIIPFFGVGAAVLLMMVAGYFFLRQNRA